MHVKFRGAFTFDEDDALQAGMQAVEQVIAETNSDFLTREHLESLGLHVTISYDGTTTSQQVDAARKILHKLAETAYSGYVDMDVDGQEERFHAKEIAPIEVDVEDIADL